MCVAVAKYFKNVGWVVAKNRDQDYISKLSFHDQKDTGVGEVLVMYDHDTGYREGMNHNGMVIITTSLTPNIEDETDKEDGSKIYRALHLPTPEKAAQFLIEQKLTGFIFIATPEKLLLIEAARTEDDKGDYHSKILTIPKSETVVRTNHGIEFPWAGFQYGYNKQQDMWRKSSENRKRLAEKAVKNAKTPEEMLDGMIQKMDQNLQMNLFRCEYTDKQMRTIFQWALIPSKGLAIIRPVQVKMKLKVTHDKLRVVVLDNEPIEKIYGKHVKHFAKLKMTDDGKTITAKSVDESLSFKHFMNGALGGT